MKGFSTRREVILLGGLIVVLALVGHTILSEGLSRREKALEDRLHQLNLAKVEADTLMEQKDQWLAKRNWIYYRQPRYQSDEEAEKELLRLAESASVRSLEVNNRELLGVKRQGEMVEAGIRLQLSGQLEDLMTWLHTIQNPNEFRAVRELSFQPDTNQPGKIFCNLTVFRIYRLNP